MIKLENVVLASPEQMEFIIEGMRNPMNSREKSDSDICRRGAVDCSYNCAYRNIPSKCPANIDNKDQYIVGPNDRILMQKLSNAGIDHRKFMRMMPVYVRITAPLYWWKEFDTYKVGTVANSCSTMHKIQEKEFTLEDFSTDQLSVITGEDIQLLEDTKDCDPTYYKHRVEIRDTISELNFMRRLYLAADKKLKRDYLSEVERKHVTAQRKKFWWQMIQLLPSSYNQTRNVMMNYEVLANIYKSRKDHKLDEWREFCKWAEELPYSELIIDNSSLKSVEVGETITAEFKPKILFGKPFPWIKEDKED